MDKELQEQLDVLLGEKEVGKLNIISAFIDQNFIEKEVLREMIEKTQGDCIKDPFDNEHEFLSKAKLLELLK